MTKPRLLYMGTPDFAVRPLEKILENNYPVCGVVTAPDRPAGRGRKAKASSVKKFAQKKGLEVLQPENLKADIFQQELKRLQPDLIVVVAFRMLPEKVWAFPKLGTFNLHASLLPNYRGAAPINWAIINGERETGVSTFMLDERIDTGGILLQKKLNISQGETAGELHDRLQEAGSNLVVETLAGITTGKISPKPQRQEEALQAAPKLDKDNTKIDWQQPGEKIAFLIHGLSPFPSAWCNFRNGKQELRCKLYRVKFYPERGIQEAGTLKKLNKKLIVKTIDGYLEILELQVSGKKRMSAQDFMNGFSLEENAILR